MTKYVYDQEDILFEFDENDQIKARYYDPTLGRFINGDPIGFAGGDVNFYVYVQNNPVNFVDPEGEYIIFVQIAAKVVVPIVVGSYIFYKWWTSPSHKGTRDANDKLGEAESIEECLPLLDKYNDARQKAIQEMGLGTELLHQTRTWEGPGESIPYLFVPTPSVPSSND